jgi:hypothetical protein
MSNTAVLTLEHAIVHVASEATLARIPLCRVEERLIRTVSGLDQPATFVVIERLECGHKLTIYPKADPLTAKYRRCKQCEVSSHAPAQKPLAGGNRGWWRVQGLIETLEDPEFRMASSMLRLIGSNSEESADESTGEHTPTLKSAVAYLHHEAQLAQSQNEYEDFSISLQLLGLLHDGWSGGPGILDVACEYLFELPHSKYLHRRLVRADFLHRQLLRCIPDYDASNEMPPEDDPTDGRRGYHGNRFDRSRDLDTAPMSPDDPTATSEPTTNYAAAGGRMGDRPEAHDRQSVPNSERAAGRPGDLHAYRRSAPKKISSPAQILAFRRYKDHETRGAVISYFGA